jgi:hypothetical protein
MNVLVLKIKKGWLNYLLFLFLCFALVLILFCSQHGYIFLAGAGSATPDEVKSGRHTEYRLIKYGISTLCQEDEDYKTWQSVDIRQRIKPCYSPSFFIAVRFLGQGRSRVLVDVYRIYTTEMSFMLPYEFQFVFLCGKDGILCLGSRPLPTKQ